MIALGPLLLAALAQDPVSDPAPRPPDRPVERPAQEPPTERPADRPVDQPPQAPPVDAAPGAPGGQAPAPEAKPSGAGEAALQQPDASVPALVWDGRAPADANALGELLARFAAAWPKSFRARELGKSRGGAAIWLGVVTRAAPDDEGRLPALLRVPGAAHDALARELNACAGLLDQVERDAALAALLGRSSVQLLFAPEPERAFAAETRAPALDFPVGWSGAPGRPHPLFEPETRIVAEHLLKHPSIGVCAFEDAAAEAPFTLGAAVEARAAGGSLALFAREYLGAALASPAAVPETVAGRKEAGERLALLIGALPRLEAEAPALERVRPDHWIVEIAFGNAGRAGTLEGAAAARERSSVWADFTGADLAAVALARGDADAVFEPMSTRAGAFELGHLAGGERVRLRLVVRGAEGVSARLALRSLRAGAVELPIELR